MLSKLASYLFCCCLCISSITVFSKDLDLSSTLVWRLGVDRDTAVQFNILDYEQTASLDINSNLTFNMVGLLHWDSKDKLEPGILNREYRSTLSRDVTVNDDLSVSLREFYFDYYLGDLFIRAGKQQIAWGQADNIRVLDVINPTSFSEFILPDIENRRIPLWSVMLETSIKSMNLQAIWVPDSSVNEFSSGVYPFFQNETVLRPRSFADSDYGFKLSGLLGGWDISLNYLSHFRDTPAVSFDPSSRTTSLFYERSSLIGASFSKPIGGIIFRGEVGYESNKSEFDGQSKINASEASYLVGIDYSGKRNLFISAQFNQDILFADGPMANRKDELFTLLVNKKLYQESHELETTLIYDLDGDDYLLRGSYKLQRSSNRVYEFGYNYFGGDRNGNIGRFSNASHLYMSIVFNL